MLTMIGCHTCFVNEREDKKPWAWDRYPWFLALRYCVAGTHFIVGPLYRRQGGTFVIPLVHAIILIFHRLLKFVNKALHGRRGGGKGYEPSSIKNVKTGGGDDALPSSKRGSKRLSARASKINHRINPMHDESRSAGRGGALPGVLEERESEAETGLEDGVSGGERDGTELQAQASVEEEEEEGEREYGSDDEIEEEAEEEVVAPRVSLADHLGLKIPNAFRFSVG
jgi:hypothetical protein